MTLLLLHKSFVRQIFNIGSLLREINRMSFSGSSNLFRVNIFHFSDHLVVRSDQFFHFTLANFGCGNKQCSLRFLNLRNLDSVSCLHPDEFVILSRTFLVVPLCSSSSLDLNDVLRISDCSQHLLCFRSLYSRSFAGKIGFCELLL